MTSETTRALIVVTATLTVVLSIASMVGLLTGRLVTVATLGIMSITLGLLVFQMFDVPCERSYNA
ncbi:hypothetical protein [Halogeometricum sp. CBA1124]|uniref:hypothetical protein n=1 Tax=Halogeometricum sp. CBA1124 TaxID=2668071 RepID=UPI00142B987A|nr:hypothetical protein [Halogeometricum sp. CBA1124]MUV56239.1 hypothetical protein [Halogeometricum sp. CBA1124]